MSTFARRTHTGSCTSWPICWEVSVAYVDRLTVEAHLERSLSDQEWAAVAEQLTPMAFDEHVGEAGTFRTDWIEDVLAKAGVRSCIANSQPAAASVRRRP